MLYKLIKNTLNYKIAPPTRGWGSKPLAGDELNSDDIERIRFYRNELAHNTEFKISDQEFQAQWKDLSQVYQPTHHLRQITLKCHLTHGE